MAKYRVYLKDGTRIFNVEATSIETNDTGYIFFRDGDDIAMFNKASVDAIINVDFVVDLTADIAIRSGALEKGDTSC